MSTARSTSAPSVPLPWDAPLAPGALDSRVEVPGSKSLTNRYLVLAALAQTPSVLHGALVSRDTDLMTAALIELGVSRLTRTDDDALAVTPLDAASDRESHVHCGLAGTVMRFLPPVATLTDQLAHFDGDPQARVRPMGPMLTALRALGAQVNDSGRGSLPFTVRGPVRRTAVDVDASSSSQFVSGLLLSAPRMPEGLTVRHTGATLPSLPHIDMTVSVLREAGVDVDDSRPHIWQVQPGPIAGRELRVEPDLSNAAPFLSAALVAGGTVRVPGWPETTTQPGARLPELLTSMGATVRLDGDELVVTGTGEIHGIDVDLHDASELTPTIAALATLADSPTRLRGVAHIRGHETDRLAALATEITRVGGQAEQTADGLVITPRPLHGALWETYHDHRMATAGAIVGLRVPGMQVADVQTTAKTLPGFVKLWTSMLGGV